MSAPPADVVDRLERLAAHAPGGAIDPDAVWTHGRRRRRVRLGAALAAVVAVGLLGTTVTPLLVDRVQRVEPADPGEGMVLPNVIRQPGGWEPAFPAAPGRLSAVGVGSRSGLLGDRNAVWGVSAATGESRFLDLPGSLELGQPALSHDGSRVAYWIATTADVDALGQAGESAMLADGVAVLDLETGERDAWTVDSDHGLWIGGMAWAGDVLWWSAGPARAQGDGALVARSKTRTWDLDTGERDDTPSSAQRRVSANGVGDAPNGFVEQVGARRVQLVSGAADPTVIRLALPDGTPATAGTTQAAVSPDGSRLAGLLMPDRSRSDDSRLPVVAGELRGGDVTLSRVVGAEAQAVLGWRSPTQVVVASVDDVEAGRPQRANRAWTLDVTTREQEPLLAFSGNTPQVAADAWAGGVIAAPDAPFAPDPRIVGLGLLVAAFVGWRIAVRVRSRRGHA
jgi:hypothetical protein